MPYIKKEKRGWFNGYINAIVNLIVRREKNDTNSLVAYVIYKIIKYIYGKPSWEVMSDGIKVLDSVKEEFRRRELFPYENRKIEENGDV